MSRTRENFRAQGILDEDVLPKVTYSTESRTYKRARLNRVKKSPTVVNDRMYRDPLENCVGRLHALGVPTHKKLSHRHVKHELDYALYF